MRTEVKHYSEHLRRFREEGIPLPRMAGGEKTLDERIEETRGKIDQLVTDAASGGDVKALQDQLNELKPTLDSLEQERKERADQKAMDDLKAQVETMKQAMDNLREPGSDFIPDGGKAASDAEDIYGGETGHSFYADIKAANKGNQGAWDRIAKSLGHADVKAMTEGTDSAGGYLVPPQISSELLTLREQSASLRPLFSQITVTSDTYQIPAITSGLSVGWVAELAAKPASDLVFGQISTSVFTAAGLAVVSNQLLQDARPSIDGLINAELAKRLALLEEVAFIDGDGTNKPTGILNTAGISTVALTSTAILDLLDAILTALTTVEINHQEYPSAIVMHPRTWNRIVAARDTAGSYVIGDGANSGGRRASDARPARSLFGVPVYTTPSVPTNKGAGTNESRVIVGAFNEGLILDHTGVTLDESPHVYFTTNQTVFRGEMRVGFTAARYPKAFAVVQGAGLANG